MRGVALAFGIVGGVLGFGMSFFEFVIGALGKSHEVAGLAFLAFAASVVGIVGGALAMKTPLVAGIVMVVATIAGFIAASAFWGPSGVFLFVGALLAFLAWFTGRRAAAPVARVD